MPRFLIGDEQGNIKSFEYNSEHSDNGTKLHTLSRRSNGDQKSSIQRMAMSSSNEDKAVVAAYSDGIVTFSRFRDDEENLEVANEWKDGRLKKEHSYIGLAMMNSKIYTCSTNGALQMTTVDPTPDASPTHHRTSLPTRLYDWKLSPDSITFAYGGDEVDLSVWNTKVAFERRSEDPNNPSTTSKKRKRNNELFPGEVWRAKNVANDFLGLRQPIRITSIDYLVTGSSGQQLIAGTQLGDVRRYDTRAARRPVADWKGLGRAGGIEVVKKGLAEHELFVSDNGTNLFSVDLRNGRIVYSFKGLSGAVNCVAPSPGIMVSTALDRYIRIHTTFGPPVEGRNLDRKGDVVEKIYATSIPTVALWDDTAEETEKHLSDDEQVDDVWNDMEQIVDDDTGSRRKSRRRQIT